MGAGPLERDVVAAARPVERSEDHERCDDGNDESRYDEQPPPELCLARRDRAVAIHVIQGSATASGRREQPDAQRALRDAQRPHGCLLLLGVGAVAPVVSTAPAYRGRRGGPIPPSERM